jgi:hypothetical protein
MKKLFAPLIAAALIASLVLVFPPQQAAAIAGVNVITAAGAGEFATGASFQGIALAGGTFGLGVQTSGTGSANGDLELQLNGSSLIGLSQWITVTGWITSGTVNPDSSVTLNGTGTLDLGDGSAPTGGLALTATLTATGLTVTIGGNAIPTLPKSDGWITVE